MTSPFESRSTEIPSAVRSALAGSRSRATLRLTSASSSLTEIVFSAPSRTIATLAFTEPNGRWDESGIEATATADGDGWKISGTKSFVLDGHTADLVLVAARTPAGVSLFHVAGDASGLTRTALATMDRTRKQAKLEFANVAAAPLGEPGAG